MKRYIRNRIWPFYFIHRKAGLHWNLSNLTFAFGDWIYHSIYNRVMDIGWGFAEKSKRGIDFPNPEQRPRQVTWKSKP